MESARAALLGLPRVSETMQWGGKLVYWVLDRAVGGRIFAILDPEAATGTVVAFAAGPQRMAELLELDGVRPAPHLARAHWVALVDWTVMPGRELYAELGAAHAYVSGRLPPRVQRLQDLPPREYRALVRERRAAAKAAEAEPGRRRRPAR